MTEKVTVSVILDQKTLDKVIDLQKETNNFSRSGILKKLIDLGLESVNVKEGV